LALKKMYSNPLKQSKENTCKSFIQNSNKCGQREKPYWVDYLSGVKCESIMKMLEEIGFLTELWVRIPEFKCWRWIK
jgi:hypothetical protein